MRGWSACSLTNPWSTYKTVIRALSLARNRIQMIIQYLLSTQSLLLGFFYINVYALYNYTCCSGPELDGHRISILRPTWLKYSQVDDNNSRQHSTISLTRHGIDFQHVHRRHVQISLAHQNDDRWTIKRDHPLCSQVYVPSIIPFKEL